MPTKGWLLWAWVLCAVAPACDRGTSVSDAAVVGPIVEIGTAGDGYQPIEPDRELPLLEGVQAGHHFVIHVRMRGLVPGDSARPGYAANPITEVQAFDDAGTRVDVEARPFRQGYVEAADGWYELPNPQILIIEPEQVIALDGGMAGLRVDIQDSAGTSVTDQVRVRVREVPFDEPDAGVIDGSAGFDADPDGS